MSNDQSQVQYVVRSTDKLTARADREVSSVLRYFTTFALTISPLIALTIWLEALRGADLNNISDLGLVSALPFATFGAIILLVFSFGIALTQRTLRVPVLLLHTVVLIFFLYGVAILVEGVPRTAIAWKLVGIMDHVMCYGNVDPSKDAFQNWPGFFFLIAFITSATGIESPLTLAAWAHVFFNLLYLAPLILLFRSTTQDKRLIWLGVWFFYLNNWIGQDYLAPQAFGYLIYLVTLGILLNWFQGGSSLWMEVNGKFQVLPVRLVTIVERWLSSKMDARRLISTGRQLAGLMVVMIVFLLVLTPSHQLTPVALMVSVAALIFFGRITPRDLPIFLGVLIVAWISYMAVPFLRGHLDVFIEPFGALTSNIQDNLTERMSGSPEHIFIVFFRICMSLLIFLFAALGFIRRLRNRYLDVNFMILAAAPFSLLLFQTYGGEILLRSYLFALPFVSFFMAALFFPGQGIKLSLPLMLGIYFTSAILGVSFFFSRYGNERMDYFRPGEIKAVEYVYANAELGSQILAGTDMLPWRFKEYNTYRYSVIQRLVRDNDIDGLVTQMSSEKYPESYLILTRSQQASAELLYDWEPGTWERFEASLLTSNKFRLVFGNADAQVYVLASQ